MNENTHQGHGGGKPPPSNANGLPEGDRAHELMSLVLEHYIKHHEVVFKKLHIAQEATVKSLQELEKMAPGLQSKSGNTIEDIRKYEHMWGAIIEMFKAHGATEDDLERIEHVLLAIPRAIKQHYDAIIQQDKALQKLIASLNTDEYKKAVAIISEVQSRPNPMTGLGPEEYQPVPSAVHNAVPSYQFTVDMLRNRD